jgi:hypothetical protein
VRTRTLYPGALRERAHTQKCLESGARLGRSQRGLGRKNAACNVRVLPRSCASRTHVSISLSVHVLTETRRNGANRSAWRCKRALSITSSGPTTSSSRLRILQSRQFSNLSSRTEKHGIVSCLLRVCACMRMCVYENVRVRACKDALLCGNVRLERYCAKSFRAYDHCPTCQLSRWR